MPLLSFFLHFFLHVLFGALAIGGFFCITRGDWEILPDGSRVKRGKIFMDWYLFWYQKKTAVNCIFYKDDELLKVVRILQLQMSNKLNIAMWGRDYVDVIGVVSKEWANEVEIKYNIKVTINNVVGGTRLHLHKEYPLYYFPTWVRDMMAGCVTCHSSWLGSICFWLPFFLVKHGAVENLCFPWTGHYIIALLLTWVAYCFTVAFVVTALWKKYM